VPEGAPRGAPPARPGYPPQPGYPAQPVQPQATQPQATQPYSPSPPPAAPGPRRGDAFDPSLNPNAPGAPRPLGTTAPSAPLAQSTDPEEPVGAPGGRTAGAPLDLSTLTGLAEMPMHRRLRRAIPAAIPAVRPVARRLRRCRPLTARRILTILPTATSCAGICARRGYVSAVPAPLPERSTLLGRAILARRKPVPAPALSRRGGALPQRLDQI
jgi:hypothetical protein